MLAVKRSAPGFTLLELLITIAVVAVLASIAVPSFQNMIATQRMRSAANDLLSTLNFARSEAVKRNAEVVVNPSGSWGSGWSITVGGTLLRNHEGFDGLTLTSKGPNGQISFIADGRRGDDDAIEIVPPTGSGASTLCISVGATGKPSSKSGAC